MNYFAHGCRFVDDPYFVAGTALPDWLSVVDRRVRVRTRHASALVSDDDPRIASLARGVVQHHEDDRWFHQTRAFAELSLALSGLVRGALPPGDRWRPRFLGHILVELLLDAELIAADPGRLEAYYRAVESLQPRCVAAAVERMTGQNASGLAVWVPRFSAERFLWDYGEDAKLCLRLNQVLRRVKLPQLPHAFVAVLPEARRRVHQHKDQLLPSPWRIDHEDRHEPPVLDR